MIEEPEKKSISALWVVVALGVPFGLGCGLIYLAAHPPGWLSRTSTAFVSNSQPPTAVTTTPILSEPAKDNTFDEQVQPFLAAYCIDCHSDSRHAGGISLEKYKDRSRVGVDAELWLAAAAKAKARQMPPPARRQPAESERDEFVGWVEKSFGQSNPVAARPALRRLNKAEYNCTIRDLFDIDFQPADDFPSDDVGYGFDNIGDVLTLSPILMEKYLSAAEKVLDKAIVVEKPMPGGSREVPRPLPTSHRRIMIAAPLGPADKGSCARAILQNFVGRAYRRPALPGEIDRLYALFTKMDAAGEPFEKSIQFALKAVLVSPHFLFHVEKGAGPASEFELASRLSYFIWSSMPDDNLFVLAEKGELRKPGVIEEEVRRLLADPKSRALADNFAAQWLNLRIIPGLDPNRTVFPKVDAALLADMVTETELYFQNIAGDDRSVLEFLDSNWTIINDRLAAHYGFPGVSGPEFRKVVFTDRHRGGVLTHASVLTLTSNPSRTSPVKRGKWILENILGTPPLPPPPNVPNLEETAVHGTLRQQMEQHRANPSCAGCHQQLDPLGFGLENFDGVGAWRGRDGSVLIDSTGELPGGEKFDGPAELRQLLLSKADLFRRNLAAKMLTYAIGRGLDYRDQHALDEIVSGLKGNGDRFSALVVGIVKSEPFQNRRGGAP